MRGATMAVLAGLLLLAAGCGDGKHAVRGKVYFDGQAMKSGTVWFHGADGAKSHSAIGVNGDYEVQAVARGEAVIVVQSHPRVPSGFTHPGAGKPPGKDDGSLKIPDHYGKPGTSPLKVKVPVAEGKFDIDLDP